jgi:hypothetical protein
LKKKSELDLFSSDTWDGMEFWNSQKPWSIHNTIEQGWYVESGRYHQFESLAGCEALEIYDSVDGTPPDENDIVRFSEGGILKSS